MNLSSITSLKVIYIRITNNLQLSNWAKLSKKELKALTDKIKKGFKVMLSEQDIRLEINLALENKGWTLTGDKKNVFCERRSSVGQVDYLLKPAHYENPLIIIEAKRKGKNLNLALEQAKRYAEGFRAPIAYASDGSIIKTLHLSNLKPLMLNGEELDQFISETMALQYLHTHEYNTLDRQVIKSRKELIQIFSGANKELRKEGLQAGMDRFSEFCNILFLKIFSEEEEIREEEGSPLRIDRQFRWNYFKNKEGFELLSYVNDTVLKTFQQGYSGGIFTPLQIKNPKTLKRIIDDLDPLSLVNTNSDIKGDDFEYFLKAYLSNQSKDLGEYFTPRHIVKTLVKLINPKFGETVYDPFCGTGGMLIESFQHIKNKMPINSQNLEILKKKTIYGGEITKNARITKMNMILTGDGHNNIWQIDSLKTPSEKKYDVVITNMPFSLGNFDEDYSSKYKLGSSNGNNLCVEHCFNAIDKNSSDPRIGIIVPEGILFDKKYTKLRDYIYSNSNVESIISLPSGTFKPYTDVKTSILYLAKINKKKESQKFLWHFTVKNDGHTLNTKRQKIEGENDLDVFLSYNNREDEDALLRIGFNKLDIETIKKNDYVSIPNPYKKFLFNSKFETVSLGELTEEITTRNKENVEVWSVTNDKGFIRSEDRFAEQVASDNTFNYKIVPTNGFAYNPSRINVGSIAFNDLGKNGCVSPMYIIFRCKNEKRLHPGYLYWLMQSESLKEQIRYYAFGSVRQTLNFNDFCNIKIPVPTIEEQERIISELGGYINVINGIKQSVSSWQYNIVPDKNIMKLEEIATFEYGYTATATEKGEFRLIRITDIDDFGYITKDDPKYADLPNEESKFILNEGDIVVARTGATYGKTAIFKGGEKSVFASYLIRISLDKSIILPKYYWYFSQSNYYWQQAENLINGTGQPQFNANALKEMLVPFPPINVQKQIIEALQKEEHMLENQKNIMNLFKGKIEDKLDSLWQVEEKESDLVADKSVFDVLIKRGSKPVQH